MKKYIKFIPLGFLLFFILTNPSISDFKSYIGSNTYQGLHRESNWYIFSTYSTDSGIIYRGFIGNFFRVKPVIKKSDKPTIWNDSDEYEAIDTSIHNNVIYLYRRLKKDNVDVGTIYEFNEKLKSDSKINILYKYCIKQKYPEIDSLSLEQFKLKVRN